MRDRLLNITAEEMLVDTSLRNFMPPELPLLEHSYLSVESYLPATATYGILAGARLDNLFLSEDSIDDIRYFTPYAETLLQRAEKVETKQPTQRSYRTDELESPRQQNPLLAMLPTKPSKP